MVIERAGTRKISLLKIDAEGAEVDMLARSNTSFESVEHIAVECHDQLRPQALSQCRSTLVELGFQCKLKPVAPHAGVNMLLGYKRVAI
jgi:hypothetical protein